MTRLVLPAILLLASLAFTPARADVVFELRADVTEVAVGDTFVVDVVVPVEGDAFNGYDAILTYDAAQVAPIVPLPASTGEGELFTDACFQRFLDLGSVPDSALVRVSHVLLCAGTSVAGPGRVYSIEFRALADAVANLGLGSDTQAYDAGAAIPTTVGTTLTIVIGDDTTSNPPAPGAPDVIAFPNPFNPSTTLRVTGEAGATARLNIYDAAGRRLRTLFDGRLPGPVLDLQWDGRDASGQGVASGTYFARLNSSRGTSVTRLVLLR